MKNEKINKQSAITLIALIITIIIMLILAGITLNLTLGEHGIFKTAMDAKNKYIAASEDEQKALQDLYKELGLENLPENSKEHPQDAGKEVALKDGWGKEAVTYTNTKNGLEVTGLTKIATVYAVSVGNGDTVPVPKGFYYVGGTLDTGVIISDSEEDKYDGITDKTTYEYTRSLKGNQFVWTPCEVDNYKKTNLGQESVEWDTTTPKSELVQIEKYGGFYVARYEAGLAKTISEFTETQTNTGSNPIYNLEGIPQSKAGVIPWNFIDWNMSKKNAESMYNNEYVSSGLITGTQWDVILNTMINKGKITSEDAINSKTWGNYANTVLTYTGKLAKAYNSSSQWYLPAFPTEETTNGKTEDYTNNSIYGDLLTTGASSETQKYHIFDIAGNLWEWTEEDFHKGNSGQVRTTRGGAYISTSDTYSAYTHGSNAVNDTRHHLGFRPVLYIK